MSYVHVDDIFGTKIIPPWPVLGSLTMGWRARGVVSFAWVISASPLTFHVFHCLKEGVIRESRHTLGGKILRSVMAVYVCVNVFWFWRSFIFFFWIWEPSRRSIAMLFRFFFHVVFHLVFFAVFYFLFFHKNVCIFWKSFRIRKQITNNFIY